MEEIILKDTPELKIIDKPGYWVEINGIRYSHDILNQMGEIIKEIVNRQEITERGAPYLEVGYEGSPITEEELKQIKDND